MHCNPVVRRDTRGNQVTNQHVGYSHNSTALIGFILKVDTVDVLGLKQQPLCISRAVGCDIGISESGMTQYILGSTRYIGRYASQHLPTKLVGQTSPQDV